MQTKLSRHEIISLLTQMAAEAKADFESAKKAFVRNAKLNPAYAIQNGQRVAFKQQTFTLYDSMIKLADNERLQGDLLDAYEAIIERETDSLYQGQYRLRSTDLLSVEVSRYQGEATEEFLRKAKSLLSRSLDHTA